jgi:methylated-DNA-[protein]-cysteine S-methyltransferase
MHPILYAHVDSPLGELLLTSRGGKLSGVYFADQPHARTAPHLIEQPDADIFSETQRQLEEYATGIRQSFDLPLDLSGSPFQVSVWKAINAIPFGKTISYGELAGQIDRTVKDARAVGTATGLNPLCWIVPCHRVVGKDGSMTGYAGGLSRKVALLEFEKAKLAGKEAVLMLSHEQPALALV